MFKPLIVAALIVTAPAAVAAEAPAASDKVICKNVQKTTGWRLSPKTKVCKKAREWDAEARETAREREEDRRSRGQ